MCCDLNEDLLEILAEEYSCVSVTRDYSFVLADPKVDAVVLATPAQMHFAMAKRALDAGKHVFVEKPLSLQVEDAEFLYRQAEETGLVLMVGHLMVYHPGIRKLKHCVDSGSLGDIQYIYTQRVNFGIVRKNESVLWSLGPHDVSVVAYLLDQEPHTVSAHGASYIQKGVEDVVFCNLRYSNNVMAQIHVSWLDPHKIRRLTIVGNQRMAVFDDLKPIGKIHIYENSVGRDEYPVSDQSAQAHRGVVTVPDIENAEPLRLECEHFLECIRKGERPCSDGRDGLRVIRVLDAAQRSMNTRGVPIKL